jgi:hypothetical protein
MAKPLTAGRIHCLSQHCRSCKAYATVPGEEPCAGGPARAGGAAPAPDAITVRRLLYPVARRLARDTGFELDPGHVALSGRCSDCAGGGGLRDAGGRRRA